MSGRWSFGHEFAGDVVDGGDVVGVDGVTQAEAVGEECGAEQDGVMAEGEQRPEPGGEVGGDQAEWRGRRAFGGGRASRRRCA